MYDYPLARTSSSTPPSPHTNRKQRHRRSQSPLPHLSTLLPSSHNDQYSPSSRAADISRLLDPAYASSSTSSSSVSASPSSAQTRVYVDHNGEIHDPDYRDFPVLRPPTAIGKGPSARRRPSAGSASRSHSHDRYRTVLNPPRPSWERGWDASDDEDDEEDDSHFSPFASRHSPAPQRRHTAHGAYGGYAGAYASYYFPSEKVHGAATSSPGHSYESEGANALQLHESPFEEDGDDVMEPARKTSSLIRRVSRPRKTNPSLDTQAEKDEGRDGNGSTLRAVDEEGESDDDVDEHATTPTCTHILRQHWQAISLRIRFSVYRAKRRLRRRA